MPSLTLLSISALAALVPAALLPYRDLSGRDTLFWLLLAVALAGPLVWVAVQFAPGWRTGLAPALWATVSLSLAVFAVTAAVSRQGWRLATLLLPYLLLLGILATVWQDQPGRPFSGTAPVAWIQLHIVTSVVSYAILTVAAVAGLAAFLQDRALRSKQRGALAGRLPSLSDCESLQVRLLAVCAVVMGLGLVTGMATQYFETGLLLALDHKTLLALATFVVLVLLLAAYLRTGIRGRRAARIVLLVYLLATLGYPGVKFVTDVLIA